MQNTAWTLLTHCFGNNDLRLDKTVKYEIKRPNMHLDLLLIQRGAHHLIALCCQRPPLFFFFLIHKNSCGVTCSCRRNPLDEKHGHIIFQRYLLPATKTRWRSKDQAHRVFVVIGNKLGAIIQRREGKQYYSSLRTELMTPET